MKFRGLCGTVTASGKEDVPRLGGRSLNLSPLSRERQVWSVICGYTWGDFSRELKSGWCWRQQSPQLFPVLGGGVSHSRGLLRTHASRSMKTSAPLSSHAEYSQLPGFWAQLRAWTLYYVLILGTHCYSCFWPQFTAIYPKLCSPTSIWFRRGFALPLSVLYLPRTPALVPCIWDTKTYTGMTINKTFLWIS